MNFIKNDRRNRLDEPHLNDTLRVAGCRWAHPSREVRDFERELYPAAYDEWAKTPRRGVER
jgi:hypothetical protein